MSERRPKGHSNLMRKTHSSVATVIVISLLLIVNLIAFNWTSKFFQSRYGVVLLRYGERMPKLEGHGYSGDQILSVGATKPTLVLYLTNAGIKGQSIALLKFWACNLLRGLLRRAECY